MRNKLTAIFILSLISITSLVSGQKQINSPYARFNLGSILSTGSFRNQAMGGISTGIRDNKSIIFSNPASYSSLDTNSFVLDFGIDYTIDILKNQTSDFFSDDMNFDHLLMGAPISKKWGIAFGIIPYSNGYYQLQESHTKSDPDYDPVIGEYTKFHAGDGGFNNFFVGTGTNITKNFSVGVNMRILLGEIRRTAQFDFDDFYNVYNDKGTESLHLSGLNWDYGLQYSGKLKKDFFINAGISYTTARHYRTKFEHFTYAYTAYSTIDTISYISDDSTRTYVPGAMKVGISFGKVNKLLIGIDYLRTDWSKARIPGATGYTADTRGWQFGIEFIPDKFSNYSYLKRIEYRAGAHIQDNYLFVHNEQVKELGASFGLGIPMRRSLSKASIYFDYTKKTGSAENGLHDENFYTIGASLNLYDIWFVKRKYD